MIRNQFVIRGIQSPAKRHDDSNEELIYDYIDHNATGFYHVEASYDEGSGAAMSEDDHYWIVHCEKPEDADNLMAWVKLKFEGTEDGA